MVRAAARYMLDTDICIYFQTGSSASIVGRLSTLRYGEAILSVVTYGELRVGAEKSGRRERNFEVLMGLVELYPVEPIAVAVAEHYARARSWLEQAGTTIGRNDLWIAAHALASGLTLVTSNEREFRRVPGLAVENWAAP